MKQITKNKKCGSVWASLNALYREFNSDRKKEFKRFLIPQYFQAQAL